jgi:hypothetical protein
MKTKLMCLGLLAAFALPSYAQTYGGSSASEPATPSAPSSAASGSERRSDQQYGEGGSKHCDQLSGAEKQTCLQDEGAKIDRKTAPDTAGAGTSAPGGRDENPEKANPGSDSSK